MQSAEELYRIYSADLYRYLLFLTHSADHAEDLMMETFLRAITGANRFRGESSVKTWLFGIARNLWLQELRRQKRPPEEYLVRSYMEFSPEDTFDERETLAAVKRLLLKKEERERQILLHNLHIVQIILEILPFYISEMSGNGSSLCTFPFCKLRLNLSLLSSRPQLFCQAAHCSLVALIQTVVSALLIISSNLHTQMTASRMNHEI